MELFVVRLHDLSSGAFAMVGVLWLLHRARGGVKDSKGMVLALSVDITNQKAVQRVRLREFGRRAAEAGIPIRIHRYNEVDMKRTFPGLVECEAKLDAEGKLRKEIKKGRSLAWGFHAEALILCVRALRRAVVASFEYVWVAEDDIGVTADMADFVACFDACDADLVGGKARKRIEDNWWWKSIGTESYFRIVPPSSRLFCEEHIQRFSGKLIRYAEDLMMAGGVGAWSETFWPSLVDVHPDFSYASLRGFHGRPYDWFGNISEDAWYSIMRSTRAQMKVFHALRF